MLVDSPHERAWRETLERLMESQWSDLRGATRYAPGRFTAEVYHALVAGKPRLSGARAALEHFAIPADGGRAEAYAELKQQRVMELIDAGEFTAFPDAVRFVVAMRTRGLRLAAASSSKNADALLAKVPVERGRSLLDCFDADISGRDLAHGKPDPEIFLTAAAELGEPTHACFVVEDAPAGIEAAKAGAMAALGVARADDADLLADAGADLVVATLDDVDLGLLGDGVLARNSGA